MTVNDRIKKIFKDSGLSQVKIAERLHVTPAFVSLLMLDKTNASNRTVSQIAREFRVSEGWLLTGEGEMQPKYSRNESIMIGINEILADEDDSFRKRWIDVLSNLSAEQWQVLKEISDRLLDNGKKEE